LTERHEPRVEVAEGAGVCFGVRRAIRLAEEALEGDLIHNPQEMQRLGRLGFRVVESLDEAEPGAVLLIRSHGLAPAVVAEARARGLEVVDATCPLVHRVQTLAHDLEAEGFQVLVAGDAAHPEVQAIMGHAPGAVVVEGPEAVEAVDLVRRVALVAQTTFSPGLFQRMAEALLAREPEDVRIVRTICTATVERQRAAAALAARSDVVVVIGGRNSANTNRLAELCAASGVPTHHVETAEEIQAAWLEGRPRVGVAAGASTPHWIIEEVCREIRRLQSAGP